MLALAMDVMFAIVFGPERSLCNFGLYYSLLAMVQHIEIVVARSSMWSNRYFAICPWICAAWLCGNIRQASDTQDGHQTHKTSIKHIKQASDT